MKEGRHKRPHNVQYHSYEISKIGRSVITESRSLVSQGLGRAGNGEFLLMGIGVFFEDDENVLKLNSDDGCTSVYILKINKLYTC